MALPIEQPAEPEQWRRSAEPEPEPIEYASIDDPRAPFPEPRPLPHVIGRRSPGTRPTRIVEVPPPEPEPAPSVWPTLAPPTSRQVPARRPVPPMHLPPPRPAPRPVVRPVRDEPLPELRGWARNNYTLVIAFGTVALAAWLVLVVLRTPEQTAAADQMSELFDDAVADTLRAERTAAFAAWIVNVTTTFVLGGFVFRALIDRRDSRSADWSPAGALRGAAVVATVASLAAVPLRAVAVAGMGRAAMVDPEALRFVATSRFGDAALLRVAGLLMTTFAVVESPFPHEEGKGLCRARRVVNGAFGVVGVLLLLGSYAWVGHPQATTAPGPLLVLSQSVHVFAASTWFAGCALLAMQMRSARRYNGSPRTSAQLVARFSTIAGVAVAVVGTSGVALAQSQIASVDALTTTPYGRALVVKVMFVAIVVVIGGYNRQRVVPAVVDLDDAAGWRWLHRTVLFEAFLLIGGVLLATTAMTSGGF